MFKGTALIFFEARKLLLEKLVVSHKLNVLHLECAAPTRTTLRPTPRPKTTQRPRQDRPLKKYRFFINMLIWR